MTQGFTDWLQQSRFTVVAADKDTGRVRIRGEAEACTDLTCGEQTLVLADEGPTDGVGALNPGDIIRVEGGAHGRPERIVVVRRVWEELTSPEF